MEVDGFPLEMFPLILTKSRGFCGWVSSLGSVWLPVTATSWLWCLLPFLPYFRCLGVSVPQFPSLPLASTEAVCGHGWVPSSVAQGTRGGATTTSDRDSAVPTWLGQQPQGRL